MVSNVFSKQKPELVGIISLAIDIVNTFFSMKSTSHRDLPFYQIMKYCCHE